MVAPLVLFPPSADSITLTAESFFVLMGLYQSLRLALLRRMPQGIMEMSEAIVSLARIQVGNNLLLSSTSLMGFAHFSTFSSGVSSLGREGHRRIPAAGQTQKEEQEHCRRGEGLERGGELAPGGGKCLSKVDCRSGKEMYEYYAANWTNISQLSLSPPHAVTLM